MRITPLLPQVLASERLWADLFEEVDQVLNVPAERRIKKLANRHNIDALLDTVRGKVVPITVVNDGDTRGLITNIAEFLGYAYRDGGKLDTIEYYRFVEESTRFIHEKGTEEYLNFFSFLVGIPFEATHLWYTPARGDDPEKLSAETDNRIGVDDVEIDADAAVFPTPYIELASNNEWSERFTAKEQVDLFYSIAPMNIVLGELAAVTSLEDPHEIQFVTSAYADYTFRTDLIEVGIWSEDLDLTLDEYEQKFVTGAYFINPIRTPERQITESEVQDHGSTP